MLVTYEIFRFLAKEIFFKLPKNKQYAGIVCPLYGGFYLGDYLRRKFNIPFYTLRLQSYENNKQKSILVHTIPFLPHGNYLLVDDIYDTGNTMKWIEDNYPACTFTQVTLITKKKKDNLIYGEYVENNIWVDFWWEF